LQLPPSTEAMNLEKLQLFIEFPLIWLSNLKFFEWIKINFFFSFEILILLSFEIWPPPPPSYTTAWEDGPCCHVCRAE
jgi:hypothetical protein